MINPVHYSETRDTFNSILTIFNSLDQNISIYVEDLNNYITESAKDFSELNARRLNELQRDQKEVLKIIYLFLDTTNIHVSDKKENYKSSDSLDIYIDKTRTETSNYLNTLNNYFSILNSTTDQSKKNIKKNKENLFLNNKPLNLSEDLTVQYYLNAKKILEEIHELVKKIILEYTKTSYTLENIVENEYKIRFEEDTKKIYNNIIQKFNDRINSLEKKYFTELEELKKNYHKKYTEENELALKRTAEYESILNEFEKNFKNNFDSFNTKIVSLNDQTSSIQKEINKFKQLNYDLVKSIDSSNSKINDLVSQKSNELNIDLESKIKDIQIEVNQKFNEISEYYDKAKDNYKSFTALAEKAGVYELTHYYLKKAKEEKLEFKNYRRYTTISIVLAILSTIFVVLLPFINQIMNGHTNTDSEQYYSVFSRLAISIVFFILALYLSKQSSKHYECYQENYDIYLQLATIEPFISRLDEDDKILIRKELVHVYFGKKNEGKYASKGDEVTTLTTLITPIVEKLVTRKDSNTTT